jgi:hypothetical protein
MVGFCRARHLVGLSDCPIWGTACPDVVYRGTLLFLVSHLDFARRPMRWSIDKSFVSLTFISALCIIHSIISH